MRVDIRQGSKPIASVVRPDWVAHVHATGRYGLSLWCGRDRGLHLSLGGGDAEAVLRATEALRGRVERIPLEQDIRDAFAACRRELERHDGYSEVRKRSNLETFAEGVAAGVDPDLAAVAVGGGGRPETRS